MQLRCGAHTLDLSSPRVMGVLNVTPDSFSDGGLHLDSRAAVARALEMQAEGAAIIDVGGESTRPGAAPVTAEEELERVIPVIRELVEQLEIPVSIDTSKPQVMTEAVSVGAGMINDVRALREPGAVPAAVAAGVPVCLMHMQGEPRTMQKDPRYDDVVADVIGFLRERMRVCVEAGMDVSNIVIDPGFGFGKTLAHNLTLLARLEEFSVLDAPVLAGVSRKSMIGALLDLPAGERVHGSVAAAVLAAVRGGARLLRVHDVAPTVQALTVARAVQQAGAGDMA